MRATILRENFEQLSDYIDFFKDKVDIITFQPLQATYSIGNKDRCLTKEECLKMVNREVCSVVLRPYCSNNCIFCRPLGENSLMPEAELRKMEEDLYEAIEEFCKKGYTYIEVSGGDPLEYSKIAQLVKVLREKGFKTIRISTNGVKLSDTKFVDELLEYGIGIFRIPLYGSQAKIHDSITRAKGSFYKTVRGIKNVKKKSKNTEILLTSLLLKQNAHNLIPIFDLMHNLGCDDVYFTPPFISNNDYSYYIPYQLQGYFFRKLIKYALKVGRFIRFKEVPYCVIGFNNDFTENSGLPAHLGKKFQPLPYARTEVIDLPFYRKKIKVDICKQCAVSYKCDGFLLNVISRYGYGNLKPIKERKI